jgi:group I intron endonuclease
MQAFANKYGIDCMEFDLLEIVDDKANILSVEQKWLDHYTPFNEKGFNTCRFAGNTTGWVPPPEKRQMLSKLLKGVPRTQEVKEKIRSAKIGEKSHLYGKRGEDCHNFGKVRTAEMKEAIANTLRGRTLPENQKKAISESLKGKTKHPGTTLFQFDQTGKEVGRWYSVEEASKTLGISDSNISACIKGRRKIAGGFLWERR